VVAGSVNQPISDLLLTLGLLYTREGLHEMVILSGRSVQLLGELSGAVSDFVGTNLGHGQIALTTRGCASVYLSTSKVDVETLTRLTIASWIFIPSLPIPRMTNCVECDPNFLAIMDNAFSAFGDE